ncbi:MAG: hypothetical protein HQ538_01355, partial [Parcubacteria group bacterium]|nr:hypothetical protein [Parcubacteria group bacterium]
MTNCPQCTALLSVIPAGTSKKTGKPYPTFQVCSAKCGWKPPYNQPASDNPTPPAPLITDDVKKYSAKKEAGMTILNAKKGAAEITAGAVSSGQIQLSDWETTYKKVCNEIYNFTPEEFV